MLLITTQDLIAAGLLLLVFGIGVLLIGWLLGMNDRDQRSACETSDLKTKLAIAEFRLEAVRQANRKLAMRKAISTSPLEVSRGG